MPRPIEIDRLFKSLRALPGVGPRNEELFKKLLGERLIDLLFHLPTSIIDRRFEPKIDKTEHQKIATLTVETLNHLPSKIRSKPYRVKVGDETGSMDLVFFHARGDYLLKQLPLHEKRVISGRIEYFNGIPQMAHPDFIVKPDEKDTILGIEPVYPLTAGLSNKIVKKVTHAALKELPDLPEWLDGAFLKQRKWPAFSTALRAAHNPEKPTDIEAGAPARTRLAYDELLAEQLALFMVRHHQAVSRGMAYRDSGVLKKKALAALPFQLTASQTEALKEICADMRTEKQMMRLVQGDVGSGKTMVGLFAMLHAAEAGYQSALMAPTEILARQHAQSLEPICAQIGLKLIVLTGRDKGKPRQELLEQIASGQAHIIIGTHALFQEDVTFNKLGLVVIDEQHRFGVQQRLALSQKGHKPDVLVMTATPIPRTLTMTVYGDMDVSLLKDKPAGRKPIDTVLVSNKRLGDVVNSIARKITEGERVYWVCPLVEESEMLDLAAAEERFGTLQRTLGADKVGLVHGRMKSAEKDAVMEQFKNGTLSVLVATTVVEVGVDVPEATVMVIEHAERFGLSQLHQLRGRVGRGEKPSSCILLYGHPLGAVAKQRLSVMRETNDGFIIAEKDLDLRGAGEVLGTRQSGMPTYKIADLEEHGELLKIARDDAKLILSTDPHLQKERGRALRYLLYLFGKDGAVQYLRV